MLSASLATLFRHGTSTWQPPEPGPARDSGLVLFVLNSSPEGRYDVGAAVRNGMLDGIALSSGAGASVHSIHERIHGRRIGPPNPRLCLDSLRAQVRDEAERDRAHSARMPLPYSGARVMAAFARALRDFGFTLADSSARTGRIKSAPRAKVSSPAQNPAPARTWSFPDSIAVELVTWTVAADSSMNAMAVFAPVRAGVVPTAQVIDARYEVGSAIWTRTKWYLGSSPPPP
jgi:hypothetical protein